jgi:hypothetical protein
VAVVQYTFTHKQYTEYRKRNIYNNFFSSPSPPPNATTCPFLDFVVSPPGCGWSVTDFLGWDAHEAQLRCPDEVDGDIW